MRMTESNWQRIHTHRKKRTIRTKQLKDGLHSVLGGPRFKPIRLGVLETKCLDGFPVRDLTEIDADLDGFDTLTELIIELSHRNAKLTADTIVYPHEIRIVKEYIHTTTDQEIIEV